MYVLVIMYAVKSYLISDMIYTLDVCPVWTLLLKVCLNWFHFAEVLNLNEWIICW